MTLHIDYENGFGLSLDPQVTARAAVDAALSICECPYKCEISLMLVHSDRIRQINYEQRGLDAVTDVLSFPLLDFTHHADFSIADLDAEGPMTCFHPVSGELMLGDIVLNLDRVASQALEYGHSELREFSFLIVHSVLHLIGFDHMNESDRLLMEQKQRDIMNALGILRDDYK